MSQKSKALIWASAIILIAFVMQAFEASTGASIGVITGLSGAAWGALQNDTRCSKSCLK